MQGRNKREGGIPSVLMLMRRRHSGLVLKSVTRRTLRRVWSPRFGLQRALEIAGFGTDKGWGEVYARVANQHAEEHFGRLDDRA